MLGIHPFSRRLGVFLGLALAGTARGQNSSGYLRTPDGVRIYYEVVGNGPATVLVPGRLFLEPRLRALAINRRVVFYDTRGRGLSDAVRDSSRETIMDDVRDLEAVRRHLNAAHVTLVGWSYMGLLVAVYAREHAEHVDRVVQMGPVPMESSAQYPPSQTEPYASGVDTTQIRELDSLQRSGYESRHPREYCERDWLANRSALVGDRTHVSRLRVDAIALCSLTNEWPVHLDRHVAASIASIQLVHWSAADIAKVTMPVLTIHGTRDRNAPYGGGREWAMKLADARLLTVVGGAHSVYDEYPEIVLPAIETFLQGHWPAAAERVKRSR